jgi:hypothetical protein
MAKPRRPGLVLNPDPETMVQGSQTDKTKEEGRLPVSLHLILYAFLRLSCKFDRSNKSFSFIHATDIGPRRVKGTKS